MSVPQDDLTDNFNWSSRAAGMGGGMPSAIMRSQIHTRELACLFDHYSSGVVCDRKNALFELDAGYKFAKKQFDREFRWDPSAELEAAISQAIFG